MILSPKLAGCMPDIMVDLLTDHMPGHLCHINCGFSGLTRVGIREAYMPLAFTGANGPVGAQGILDM